MNPEPASRPRPLYPRAMKLLRRLHLYSGLLLAPWVLLYGVTAFLFNHPGAFNDRPSTVLEPAAAAAVLEPLPAAEDLARELVDRINRGDKDRAGGPGDQLYRLIEPETIRYRGDVLLVSRSEDQELSLRAFPGGRAFLRERALNRGGAAPFARKKLEAVPGLEQKLKDGAAPTLAAPAEAKVQLRRAPRLEFRLTDGARRWRASYRLDKKDLSAELIEEGSGEAFDLRRFLLRLHLSHAYPAEANARWAWAVIVDLMAFAMVFWALSGILMWIQMKKVRLWGLIFTLISAAAAIGSVWGMAAFLS